jgi:uncharacterized membrane protein
MVVVVVVMVMMVVVAAVAVVMMMVVMVIILSHLRIRSRRVDGRRVSRAQDRNGIRNRIEQF